MAQLSPHPQTLVWKRLIPDQWADAWEERLRFLGAERVIFLKISKMKRTRIEVYGLDKKEGKFLTKEFGGTLHVLKDEEWKPALAVQQPPLRIRNRLIVVDRSEAIPASSGCATVIIPGGIAFGTGHHATTSTCLRFLADLADKFKTIPWSLLDIGTGSGILALAGKKLGAKSVVGMDFDKAAVRVAKENAVQNQVKAITFKQQDILKWNPPKHHQWNIITANLFSQVLIAAAPVIIGCMAPDGYLIISGIMRSQEKETLKLFSELKLLKIVRRGKWITALLTR